MESSIQDKRQSLQANSYVLRFNNSPATFQTMMDDELKDYVNQGEGSVYMDDIVIHTDRTEEEHTRSSTDGSHN